MEDLTARPTTVTLRCWLMRDQLIEARPELASALFLGGEIFWYFWDTGGREPLLQ
jgi:hypothetical protein